jgi:predicted dehydrogenase
MPLKVGVLSTAHVHTGAYVHALRTNPKTSLVGIWDDNIERGEAYAQQTGVAFVGFLDDLLANVDAVAIASENVHHAELVAKAAKAGKHVLCEKPLGISEAHLQTILDSAKSAGVKLMTAFPCRFAPSYQRLKQRVKSGEIGAVRAVCATNRGRCPGMWFIEKELSGGGAMIDHVVHVTDLLRDLLGVEPIRVQAQIGSNTYGQEWDDTAMLTLEFPDGVFATLDSSWSRPKNFKTWGDVTMTVVGDSGVIELDMFGPAIDVYSESGYLAPGYGSDYDAAMIGEFVNAILEDREPLVTGFDGAQASRVALAGYRSAETGQPVSLAELVH